MLRPEARFLDPEIPGLHDALDPARVSDALREMLARDPRGTTSAVRVVGIEMLKHRPGRRCALAYTVDGAVGRVRLFGKVYARDRGATTLHTLRRLAEVGGVRVPKPLGYLREMRLLVTEFVDGPPLARALLEGRSRKSARRIASALAAIHRSPVRCGRAWTAADEVASTRRAASSLAGSKGIASAAGGLLEELERRAAVLPAHVEGLIHRDFYADQAIDAGAEVVLLDWDDARDGDPAVDTGNFIAHMTLRGLQFPETAAGCARTRRWFLEAYLEARGADDPTLAARTRAFHEAVALLRLAGVYAERERWAATLPPRLITACAQSLERSLTDEVD